MKIGFDLQGGDSNYSEPLSGLTKFINLDTNTKIVVYLTKDFDFPEELAKKVDLVYCEELVKHDDSVLDIRRKKDSTLIKGLNDLNEGLIDGLISAGASGPLMAGSYLTIKTFDKSIRPAFAPLFMGFDKRIRILLDAGANVEVDAQQLMQFAIMGGTYASLINNIDKPKIGLLNIGKEAKKGTKIHQESYKLLMNNEEINFIGNIEANDIIIADYDVLVSDGFSGNILLKSYEGALKQTKEFLKSFSQNSPMAKVGLLFGKKMFKEMETLQTDERLGAAIVLGLNKPVIKIHGDGDRNQFFNSFKIMENIIKTDLINKIKEKF